MGFTSAGAGSPVYFMCPKERRERNWARWGRYTYSGEHRVTLTGATRPYRAPRGSALGIRSDEVAREYTCSCGHKGWSNHMDLARMAGEVPSMKGLQ